MLAIWAIHPSGVQAQEEELLSTTNDEGAHLRKQIPLIQFFAHSSLSTKCLISPDGM